MVFSDLLPPPSPSGEAILDHGLGVILVNVVSSHLISSGSTSLKRSSPAEDEIGSMWESEITLVKCETIQVYLFRMGAEARGNSLGDSEGDEETKEHLSGCGGMQ